jgi:hypothetical protein
MRIRTFTLTVGVGIAALGLIVGSLLLGALGVGLLVAGCLLFVREVRLVHSALSPPSAGAGQLDQSEVSAKLDQLLALPEVAEAWKSAPERFEQVTFLDDVPDGGWPKADVPQYVHIEAAYDEWSVAVADELFANLDLDADPDDDPMCQVLQADPRVVRVWHSNREVYTAKTSGAVTAESFAALAVRGLVAHHLGARARLLGS